MEIQEKLLTINPYSRPGKIRPETLAIVLHWTGNPNVSALANINFFENRKNGTNGYGSAQYCIGLDGEIIRCIPDDEIAYSVGSSQLDPISKKIYTNYARQKFGKYCLEPTKNSPNNCTISIEMCPIDEEGNFNLTTLESTKQLVLFLLKKYSLNTNDITTHEKIVGWKSCPMLFHNHPEEFNKLILEIGKLI